MSPLNHSYCGRALNWGFSTWEKGSEDTIVASLQDSKLPPYSPTTAKWDIEQLMQELDIDCRQLTEVQLKAVKEKVTPS